VFLINYYSGHQIKKRCGERGIWQVRGRGEVHLAYWCGKPRERDHLDDVSVNGGQY